VGLTTNTLERGEFAQLIIVREKLIPNLVTETSVRLEPGFAEKLSGGRLG